MTDDGILFDHTNKISKLKNTFNALGIDEEYLLQRQQQENEAILVCGARLGECYLMAEIVSWLLDQNGMNLLHKIKSQKWFKQGIKQNINLAVESLNKAISKCKSLSISNSDYMMDIADGMYDELQPDLLKLHNAIVLELGKYVKNPNEVGYLLLINTCLEWTNERYLGIIASMKKIFPAYYETWYDNIAAGAFNYWKKAISLYANQYITESINIDSTIIKAGILAIDRKMGDPVIAEKMRQRASWTNEFNSEKMSRDKLDQAVDNLGMSYKALPEPKQEIVEEEEEPVNPIDKLKEKYKVTHVTSNH